MFIIHRLISAYSLFRVNTRTAWDFDASNARTRRMTAMDKHQDWRENTLFCLNSRAQIKYGVVKLIYMRQKRTVCLIYYVINKTFHEV